MAQINKSSDYFNTVLYTGTNTPQSITGVGFQPDLVWIKPRDNGTWSHNLTDVVRGAGKGIFSDLTTAEFDYGTGIDGSVRTFDSDGFSIGNRNQVNYNGSNIVAWNWLADNTSGSSNTDGSITSTVSPNTTSGFSVVSYTGNGSAGATIGHGLGVIPKFIIVKGRDTASNWQVGHSSLGWTQSIRLNQTGASASRTVSWNDTDPTSSVFSVGTDSDCNTNTNDYIAYCFAEKKGFSKFGSYTGNGNADGSFIYLGFKPAWIMIKRTDTANVWHMIDNKRNTFNTVDKVLFAEDSSAEATSGSNQVDFVSNGFKARNSGSQINASGGTYIYMAFAENPLVGTNNTPATAR